MSMYYMKAIREKIKLTHEYGDSTEGLNKQEWTQHSSPLPRACIYVNVQKTPCIQLWAIKVLMS